MVELVSHGASDQRRSANSRSTLGRLRLQKTSEDDTMIEEQLAERFVLDQF